METSSRIWQNFKLIQALMNVIVTCKYEIDRIKNSQEQEIGCKQGLQYTPRNVQLFEYS